MLKTRNILNVLSAVAMVAVLTVPATSAQAQRSRSNSSSHASHGRTSQGSYGSHASHGSRNSHSSHASHSRSHSRSGFGIHLNFGHGRVAVHSGSRHNVVCQPARQYVPGYYKNVTTKVLVSAGHYDSVYHAAEYRTQYDRYGNACRVLVQAAHYDKVWHPAEYRYQTQRVYVPGHWH